jgi:hypothetical protein
VSARLPAAPLTLLTLRFTFGGFQPDQLVSLCFSNAVFNRLIPLLSRLNPNLIWPGHQGCQIFLGPKYQNEEKYTKLPQNLPNGHTIFPMAVK